MLAKYFFPIIYFSKPFNKTRIDFQEKFIDIKYKKDKCDVEFAASCFTTHYRKKVYFCFQVFQDIVRVIKAEDQPKKKGKGSQNGNKRPCAII